MALRCGRGTLAGMTTHLQLVDEVNEAKTRAEHDLLESRLNGWRDGLEHCGRFWSGIDADRHTMNKYGRDRPMCCGVLMDWQPPPV